MTKWTFRAILYLVIMLAICFRNECQAAETSGTNNVISLPSLGLSYQVKEIATGSTSVLTRNALNSVDANSDIIVTFQQLSSQEVASASPYWQQVQELLHQVDSRARKRAELSRQAERIDLKNPVELQKLQAESAKFTSEIAKQLPVWYAVFNSMGLTKAETTRIFTGEFDQRGRSDNPYANLTLWLQNRIGELKQEASTFIKSRERYRVVIEAFLDPVAGNRKALHVEGYDNLPIGELRPIDRTGLKMTPAEQQRFNMELQQNKVLAASLTEIMAKTGDLKQSTRRLFDRLQQQMAELEKGLQAEPDWDNNLKKIGNKLRERASAENNAANKQALLDLSEKIDRFSDHKTFLNQKIDEIKRLRQQLEYLIAGDLTALMQIGSLLDDFKRFLSNEAQIKTMVKEFLAIGEDLQKLSPAIRQEAEQILSKNYAHFAANLGQEMPNTVTAIKIVMDIAQENMKDASANENLAGINTSPIARNLDDLPDARIELARSGLTQGDNLTIRVRVKELPTVAARPEETDKIFHEATFKTTALLMGWHRIISADLIFARGLSGDSTATQWKPNVAASANWHYTFRNPDDWWSRVVNGVNPGVGVHLASLNQGNEGVEFGIGVNLSLFSGLLKGGGGFNLSVSEKPYVYVGIDLLNILNQAKGMAK